MNTPHFRRILSVEDDDDNSELIHLILQESNPTYQITSVKTGAEGLALAATGAFDLYVLDYRYPGMTGVDICHKIREVDQLTPILFFTGSASAAEKDEAIACGANAYLIKPDDLGQLTATVSRFLSA